MALVTVQRSPSVGSSPPSSESGAGVSIDEEDGSRNKSLSECYFAGKGAALVLPPNERARPSRRLSSAGCSSSASSGCDIQQHLQSMFYLLRPEETLKMAVKLESVHPGRTRYLVVVSCLGRQDAEECCLLGIDCNERTTVGLVLRVLADTTITLDGDGGFSVCVCGRQHIFKPVSVQAMWSALQTLHKVSSKAREQNYFLGGLTHDWVDYYEQRIESDRSCLNEWHAMDSIESRRPPSPDSVRTKPRQREETERVIRCTLKEIMMSVDLDEVTSKHIRGRLEEDLDMDLGEFKPFIDEEMLTILGQMDAATEIFEHVYLGSEWNASNHEELQKNGVRHILNVTREIDNFFPGMFNYLNIRVYDDERTDLLKHWDDTFKYISRARAEGSKVLVHCKMGVSRSASVVIAYAMKAYNWDFKRAFDYVKRKRTCIKPNGSFVSQLETYQGILDAMKNKEKLQRSKSETNLKSPALSTKVEGSGVDVKGGEGGGTAPLSLLNASWAERSGLELCKLGGRPKSWSPDNTHCDLLFNQTETPGHTSVSMEHLTTEQDDTNKSGGSSAVSPADSPASPASPTALEPPPGGQVCPTCRTLTRSDELPCRTCFATRRVAPGHVRIPCGNGQMYSVSQNRIVFLPDSKQDPVTSVRVRVSELEAREGGRKEGGKERRGLALQLQEWDPGEKPRDPFSDKLDRVFEREEGDRRQSPSRQSSWSSYDSAVVLNEARDAPSRQSSWGSGDTRDARETRPSRNSSWGSYDLRPSTHNTHNTHGTVRRTKIKLEEESQASSASTPALPAPSEPPPPDTPLSVSAPDSFQPSDEQKSVPGLVQNLKKEFEAKGEDLSVRNLVGKYEVKRDAAPPPPSRKSSVRKAPHSASKQQGRSHPLAQLNQLGQLQLSISSALYNTM